MGRMVGRAGKWERYCSMLMCVYLHSGCAAEMANDKPDRRGRSRTEFGPIRALDVCVGSRVCFRSMPRVAFGRCLRTFSINCERVFSCNTICACVQVVVVGMLKSAWPQSQPEYLCVSVCVVFVYLYANNAKLLPLPQLLQMQDLRPGRWAVIKLST